MSRLATAAVWLLATSALVGCMLPPLAIPIPPAGKTGEVTGRLRVGYSTRAEVHALLGAPNRLATSRHEVWELKRDPFGLFVIFIAPDPVVGIGRFGRPIWSRVSIDYNAQGKVAGWRWDSPGRETSEGDRDFARGTSEPAPEPAQPVRVVAWTARSFALSPDGSHAALLDAQANRKQIPIIELMTGRRIAESDDWPEACGATVISLGFDGTHVHSVPRNPAPGVGLCRWCVDSGILIADPMPSPDLAEELEQVRFARLIDRFIVMGRADGGVFIWDLLSETGTALPPTELGYVATRASVSADGTVLAIELAGGSNAPPEILLHDFATGARRTVTLPGPATEAVAALAITRKGDILAAHRRTHIEVWRLGWPAEAPVLETVLLPPSTGASLAFSEDDQRLVAASNYALVWETQGWHEIGRGAPGTFPSALTPSDALEISPDGSYVATQSGLWRIAPEPSLGQATLAAAEVLAGRNAATKPPQ